MKAWEREALAALEATMAERLEGLIAPGERLSTFGESSAEEVRARFVLEGGASGERVQLESRVELSRMGAGEPEARELAIDALDLVLLEYLESGRAVRFAGVFEERELRGRPVAVRAERTFPELDAQADALLKGER